MKNIFILFLFSITSLTFAQNSIRLVDLNSNYLSIDNSNGAFFETGDFTFEMWIKIDAWDTGGYAGYKAGILSYNQSNFWLAIQSQGKPQLRMGCGDLTFSYTASDWVGNWKHIALVRVGETLNWYVDGQLSASKSCSGGKFMDTNTINIGTNPGWTCSIDGWISKIRYVKGTAVYTSDFTPVFQDLENISGTELLLNVANETDAFKDSSNANHTINLHGSNANPYFVANNGPLMPADILLSGDVSIENNSIKNVADPVYAQDAATKSYVDNNVNSFSGSYNDLTDQPSLRDLTGDNPVIFGSLSAFGGTYNNRAILDLVANTEGNLITGYKNGSSGDRFNVKLDNTNENAVVSSGGGYNLKLYSEGGTMEFEGDAIMSTPSFTFNGAVTATSFAGDGSQLTNLPTSDVSYNDLTDKPTTYTQAQVDALIQNLQTQIDGLTPPQGTAAINHNNKTYSGVSCEGFWLGFKFSVSETQTITALGAWDEGHNIDVNNEFSSCPDASNFSVPIAIYKNDVLVLEKVINASTGFVIGSSRYIKIDDFVLTPGDEYFIIGNYEGSSKYGYFDTNLVSSNYDSRITPLTVTSSPLFSKNTNGDGTSPSNLTTLPDNQWSDQYFHVIFLLKN